MNVLPDTVDIRNIPFNYMIDSPFGFLGAYQAEIISKDGDRLVKRERLSNGRQIRHEGLSYILYKQRSRRPQKKRRQRKQSFSGGIVGPLTQTELKEQLYTELQEAIGRHIQKYVIDPMGQSFDLSTYFARIGVADRFRDGFALLLSPMPLPCSVPDQKFEFMGKTYILRWYAVKPFKSLNALDLFEII
jgi:hypothetical protein